MASSSEIPAISDKEIDQHIGELENVGTEEELEKKLDSMSILGFSIANIMKSIFNKSSNEPFKAEWLTVSVFVLTICIKKIVTKYKKKLYMYFIFYQLILYFYIF